PAGGSSPGAVPRSGNGCRRWPTPSPFPARWWPCPKERPWARPSWPGWPRVWRPPPRTPPGGPAAPAPSSPTPAGPVRWRPATAASRSFAAERPAIPQPGPLGVDNHCMSYRPLSAVVLAAGEGTRMRSTQPKPLHLLCGRPMVLHVLDALAELPVKRVVVVVGHGAEGVAKAVQEGAPSTFALEFVEQHVQRGTGDAAAVGLTGFPDFPDDEQEDGDVVVLPGDAPLLRPPTLAALVRTHRASDAAASLRVARLDDPPGYGRVVRDKDGRIARVVEQGDATEEERAVDEVNTSVYCFRRSVLAPALRRTSPEHANGEYYLPDTVAVLHDAGYQISSLAVADPMEVAGVNDRAQLAVAE